MTIQDKKQGGISATFTPTFLVGTAGAYI